MDFTRIMLNHSLKVEGFRASNLLQLVVSKLAVGSLCHLHLKTLRKLKRNPVVVIEVLKALMNLSSFSADVSGVVRVRLHIQLKHY